MKRTKKKIIGDAKPNKRKCNCWLENDLCYCSEDAKARKDWYNKEI